MNVKNIVQSWTLDKMKNLDWLLFWGPCQACDSVPFDFYLPTGLQSSLFLWALTGPRSLPAACVGAPRGTHIRGLVTILPARPSPPLPSVEGLRTGEEDVCAPPRPPAQAVRGPGTLRTLSLPCWLMLSSAYPRLLIFLLAILIPVSASSSPVFLMMHSAQKLNNQDDIIQP